VHIKNINISFRTVAEIRHHQLLNKNHCHNLKNNNEQGLCDIEKYYQDNNINKMDSYCEIAEQNGYNRLRVEEIDSERIV